MSKLNFTVMFLGCSVFLIDTAYGIGWLIGWLFISLLRNYRERLLENIIDFDNFSAKKYVLYLVGVVAWIAVPLLFSFFIPQYINPFAVFAAYFADRILMFIANSFVKEG